MDSKDLLIIAYMRNNARMPLTEMSRKTGIPVSTLFDRLRGCDTVLRPTCLLDFGKLGFNTRATIMLKCDRSEKDALRDFLQMTEAVNMLYKVNNGFDFMLEGVFKQVSDAEAFIDLLEDRFKILDRKTFYIVEDIKREGFLADPSMVLQ